MFGCFYGGFGAMSIESRARWMPLQLDFHPLICRLVGGDEVLWQKADVDIRAPFLLIT